MDSIDTYQLRSAISLIQYPIIGYFLYSYLLKPLVNLIDQIYCAYPMHCLPSHPIFGNLLSLIPDFKNLSNSLQATCATAYDIMMKSATASYVSVVWIGWYPIYLISGPSGVEMVMNKVNLKKGPVYKLMGLKDGLVVSEGDKWHGRRKMIEPFFTTKRLRHTISVIDKGVTPLPDKIAEHVGKPLDLSRLLNMSAINVAGETMWGIENDQLTKMKEGLADAIEAAGAFTIQRFCNPLFWVDATYKLFDIGRGHLLNNERINSLTDKTYEACVKDNGQKQPITNNNNAYQESFLNFLKSKADSGTINIDSEGIKEELLTMLAAGHSSTALGIYYTLFMLGHYPEIQERLYQEIVDIFPKGKPVDDLDALKKCTFLDQCIKESFRLHPPIPVVLRTLAQDIYLDGKRIPKNSRVAVNIAGTHRDPRVYSNPNQYDPDRWSPENASKIPKGSYVPFALGARNCIGYRYALYKTQIYLIHIIRQFKLESVQNVDKITWNVAITLRADIPLEIVFTNRD